MEKDANSVEVQEQPQTIVHKFDTESLKASFTPRVIVALFIVLAVGITSGYLLSTRGISSQNIGSKTVSNSNGSSVQSGAIIGSNDTTTFNDTAEGVLKEGGTNGEGAFHLERPGGQSQNVYLTSSSVDLSKLIDKKIKVWGQTQKAQYAGWLMDVGRVQVE